MLYNTLVDNGPLNDGSDAGAEFGMIHDFLKEAFVVDVTNVNGWFSKNYKSSGRFKEVMCSEICPRMLLPFPTMWFEYRYSYGVIGALLVDSRTSKEVEEKVPQKITGFLFGSKTGVDDFTFNAIFELEVDAGLVLRHVIFAPPNSSQKYYGPSPTLVADFKKNVAPLALNLLAPILASVAFFHCKNVELKVEKVATKVLEKGKTVATERPAVHILDVHKKVSRRIKTSDGVATGKLRKVGWVREHTKAFFNGSKLFGKHEGAWIWGWQAPEDSATPKNSFRVWGPDKFHEPNCIVGGITTKKSINKIIEQALLN